MPIDLSPLREHFGGVLTTPKDPAYERPDTFTGPGGSWLSRSARARGKTIGVTNARVPQWISDLSKQP